MPICNAWHRSPPNLRPWLQNQKAPASNPLLPGGNVPRSAPASPLVNAYSTGIQNRCIPADGMAPATHICIETSPPVNIPPAHTSMFPHAHIKDRPRLRLRSVLTILNKTPSAPRSVGLYFITGFHLPASLILLP